MIKNLSNFRNKRESLVKLVDKYIRLFFSNFKVLEICVNACEKHTSNNESSAKLIKESLDKKFGQAWHVVVGEGFGFEVSYELKNLMYMFFAGNLAVCAWKCS